MIRFYTMRIFIRILGFLCFCISATAFSKEILIVADEWPQMNVLAEYIEQNGDYSVHKTEQDQMPQPLADFEGVIQFVHGMLYDEPARKLMDYTLNGGKLLVLHHGVSSKKKQTKGWYDFLGMELDRAEDSETRYVWINNIDFDLVNLNPEHYITSHKVTFPHTTEYRPSDAPSVMKKYPSIRYSNTEIFLNHQFTDGREKTVLLGFKYEDPKTGAVWMQDRSGWYKPKGKGMLFYLQPGQIVEDFNQPYCQMILNCFEWRGN